MLKIIGAHTSPFARANRVLCEELNIPYEYIIVPPFGKLKVKDLQFITDNNPLIKIPVLLDGDKKIFDSRIITNYLLRMPHTANVDLRTNFPATVDEENLLTVILGITDGGILHFMLNAKHPEINKEDGYMAKSMERIHSGLVWLDMQSHLGESFGVPEIALVCCLEWFQKRNIYNWRQFTAITHIYEKYCERASIVKTRIPENI